MRVCEEQWYVELEDGRWRVKDWEPEEEDGGVEITCLKMNGLHGLLMFYDIFIIDLSHPKPYCDENVDIV